MVTNAESHNVLSVARARGREAALWRQLCGAQLAALYNGTGVWGERSEARIADLRIQLFASQNRAVELE
jgi:hypothetical protein